MTRCVRAGIMILGLAAPVFGGIVFQDDFSGETVGDSPAHWTKGNQWESFEVQDGGSPYGNIMRMGIWNGGSATQLYSVVSADTFTASKLTDWWTIAFDFRNYQEWSDWDYADVLRTPGNFRLSKDQHRAIKVYASDGTLLGSTNNELNTMETWTHYLVEYKNGVLTVTASTAEESTTGTFTGAVPDYSAYNCVSLGTSAPGGGSTYLQADNVVVTAMLGSLQGMVQLDGFRGDNTTVGATFELKSTTGGTNVTRLVQLDAAGAFTVTNVLPGTYRVSVKCPGWLKTALADPVTIAPAVTTLGNPIFLAGADCNGDNTVSFEDFSILQNSYGETGAAANPLGAAAASGGCGLLGIVLASLMALAVASLRQSV